MSRYFFALCVLVFSCSTASQTVELDNRSSHLTPKNIQVYFQESLQNDSWQNLMANPQLFSNHKNQQFHFGYQQNPIWLKFSLVNQSSTTDWVFSIDNAAIDYIDIYQISQQNSLVKRIELGDMRANSKRKLKTPSQSARLNFEYNKSYTVLIKIYGDSTLFLPMSLEKVEDFFQSESLNNIINALCLGVMLALGLYNLYIYFSVRDKAFLYYSFYLGSIIVFTLYASGLGYTFVWPDQTGLQEIIPFVCLGALFHGAIGFTQYFLKTQEILPKYHSLMNAFKYAAYFGVPIALFTSKNSSLTLITLVNLFFIVTVFYTSIQAARKKFTPAYFYLLSWTFLIVGLLSYNLTVKGILSPTFFTTKAVQLGGAIEAIILSSALAYRMRVLLRKQHSSIIEAKQVLVKANSMMNQSLSQSQQLNTAKDEFLSVVSHELRTPLNGIIGNLDLIDERAVDSTAQSFIKDAKLSSELLQDQVENILIVSQANLDNLENRPSDALIENAFRGAFDKYQQQCQFKNQVLTIIPLEGTLKNLSVDWEKLVKLVSCVVYNAIKFTPNNSQISLKFDVQSIDSETSLIVEVIDQGEGMPEELMHQLSQPFQQQDMSLTRNQSGLGLGLTVALILTKVLNGKLSFCKRKSQGTRCKLRIPVHLT